MKTKIVIATALAFLVTANVFAQNNGISFGARAGVNFQNLTGKYSNGDKYSNKLIPGFNVGANAEIPVATDFYLQPGLLFTTKGAKWKSKVAIATSCSSCACRLCSQWWVYRGRRYIAASTPELFRVRCPSANAPSHSTSRKSAVGFVRGCSSAI